MKINIIKDSTVTETEITVKCCEVDEKLKKLLKDFELINTKLTGKLGNETFVITAEGYVY